MLSTWIRFAPVIVIYNGMSFFGQWYFKVFCKSQRDIPTSYPTNGTVRVVASPRLRQADLHSYLTYWLFGDSPSEWSRAPETMSFSVHYQIIVVDLAAEISSHAHKLAVAAKNMTNTPVHYLYLPLLDLQPLSDVLLEEYIELFKQLDTLAQSVEICVVNTNKDSQIEGSLTTLINFHCVMGLSRSIGVQVLYLLYCGTLTIQNYQSWIEQYYPHAHLSEDYLPQSLVEAVGNYKSIES